MSKLLLLIALLIFSLIFAEGMLLLGLYLTEPPPSDTLGRVLHYEMTGGILASITGFFVTPILAFVLYRLIRNKEWFIKLQKKLWYSFTILLIMIIVATAPLFGYVEYKKWRQNQEYEQQFTAEEIVTRWFDYPAGFNPPMKDVSIKKENGDVHLYMEYEEEAERSRKRRGSRSEFQEDLLDFIRNRILIMTSYKELKTLSLQVGYKNERYEFDQIPLKNELGKPFNEKEEYQKIKSNLREKMKLTPSIERDQTMITVFR